MDNTYCTVLGAGQTVRKGLTLSPHLAVRVVLRLGIGRLYISQMYGSYGRIALIGVQLS